MAKNLPQNLTQLANDAQRDPEAARQFLTAVYDILREIAHKQVGNRPAPGEGATEVANEVAADFLTPSAPTSYVNRQHVLGGLVTRIGHKIIDLAKRRRRSKRGGGATHVPIDSPAAIAVSTPARDMTEAVAVEEAFAKLHANHPNAYQVLKLRNEGHTVEEVADRLDVSPKTVVRWTKFGTAFLYGQLSGTDCD
jgi:DNA-directed RNA polymerase specialized sigma24 family protein